MKLIGIAAAMIVGLARAAQAMDWHSTIFIATRLIRRLDFGSYFKSLCAPPIGRIGEWGTPGEREL
jgi:hypothetical protein